MPIEFRCQQCENHLRTPDAAAGKKARCPQCGTIQDVPTGEMPKKPASPSPVSNTPTPPSTQVKTPPPQAPISIQPVTVPTLQNPYADRHVGNPYTSPNVPTGPQMPQDSRRKVMGPSIALIVTSALTMLLIGLIVIAGIVSVAESGAEEDDIAAFIICGVLFLIEAFICLGAVLMLMMKSHTIGLVASVVSVIPCTAGWCIRFPFGIWALIVLFDSSVRSVFK